MRANCLKGAPAIGKPVIPGGATDSLLPGFGHCLAFCTQGGENSREKSQMSWLSARNGIAASLPVVFSNREDDGDLTRSASAPAARGVMLLHPAGCIRLRRIPSRYAPAPHANFS